MSEESKTVDVDQIDAIAVGLACLIREPALNRLHERARAGVIEKALDGFGYVIVTRKWLSYLEETHREIISSRLDRPEQGMSGQAGPTPRELEAAVEAVNKIPCSNPSVMALYQETVRTTISAYLVQKIVRTALVAAALVKASPTKDSGTV